MKPNLMIRIILENPMPGLDCCIQSGGRSTYKIVQKQRSVGNTLQFDFGIKAIKIGYLMDYGGLLVQGLKYNRFVYINMGTFAGDVDSIWSRRIIIPLVNMEEKLVNAAIDNNKTVFVTHINGRAKDQTPASGTVKPFSGWHIEYDN